MKYENTKAQQLRKDDGYKKKAKKIAAKLSRNFWKRYLFNWAEPKW